MAITAEDPLGGAPVVPVMLIMAGGYLAWFGVHYWRDPSMKWPTDPVKSVLTGKGVPSSSVPPSIQAELLSTLAAQSTTGNPGKGAPGNTSPITGNAIADAALKYEGQGYVFGGNADKPGNWDCSSFVSYVLGHDLGLPLPGGNWGDPGFPPHTHGPTTGTYLLWHLPKPINRSQVQAGDLIMWADHIAIATSGSNAISAHSVAIGTNVTGIDAENGYHGGNAQFKRLP